MTRYLSTLVFPDDWLARLRAEVPDAEVVQITADKPTDVPLDVWRTVDVLHTSGVLPDPSDVPALRWIQLDTSGVDHVRDHPIWHTPVEITTIGGVSPVPLAQYVLFTILGFAHRLPAMLETRDNRVWPVAEQRWQAFLPARLDGATLVVVGYGRIGREIGRLAQAQDMSVIGITRTGVTDYTNGIEVTGPERMHEVLGRADYVVVVVPLTEQTRGMLDAAAISAIKPGAVLINVARGGIVDETALRDALQSGALSGAALDVFDSEPLPPDSPWWDEPNVLVTPHISGLAPRYFEQVLDLVTGNLRRLAAGAPLVNRVDRERGY